MISAVGAIPATDNPAVVDAIVANSALAVNGAVVLMLVLPLVHTFGVHPHATHKQKRQAFA